MQPILDAARRSERARGAIRVAAAVLFAILVVASARTASARLDRYTFSGTITDADIGVLFPGKSVGQTFQGSFTLDTNAMLQSSGNGGMSGTFVGDFAVVIEGVSYPVFALTVWSSGPAGIDDGFEFAFNADGNSGFLSLRSSQDLYSVPGVPTSVDLAQMDTTSSVNALEGGITFDRDAGEIEFLPEPAGAVSGLAAIAALAVRRRRL